MAIQQCERCGADLPPTLPGRTATCAYCGAVQLVPASPGARAPTEIDLRGMRADEAPLFSEPAVFLVRPDGTVQFAVINSMQRMRPYPEDIIEAIARFIETGELGRGEVA